MPLLLLGLAGAVAHAESPALPIPPLPPDADYVLRESETPDGGHRLLLLDATGTQERGSLVVSPRPHPGMRVTPDGWGADLGWRSNDRGPLAVLVETADTWAALHGGWAGRVPPSPHGWQPAIAAWSLFLLVIGAGNVLALPVRAVVRLPHLLPSAIQLSIFAYWALWWPPVLVQAPLIVAQLGLAYALDAALSLARRREWVASASPIPIVLSINLFLWFGVEASALVVLVAMLSKVALTREGRHILNPSGLALSVVGLLTLLPTPLGSFSALFHTMNIPPWMAEWILLAALIPQLRLRIVLVSLGALVGFWLAGVLGAGPSLSRPPTLLALALLATDPATIPRTSAGKLLFGLTFGVGIRVTSIALVALGQPDDLSKVLPLPLCNLLADRFDAWGARLQGTRWRWLDASHNRAHVAAWFILAALLLWGDKGNNFEAALHWQYQTPGLAEGTPACDQAPRFCRAFGIPVFPEP